jgi:diguanylate cyclase (GGDEF)-like protein
MALFLPRREGGLALRAVSAALAGQTQALEEVLGAEQDAAGLSGMAASASTTPWPVVEIVEQERLIPLRGLALALECLAVSVHAAGDGALAEGFLLALWEEDAPAAARLDRAQLAALGLGAGLEPEPIQATVPARGSARQRAGGPQPAAEDTRRVQAEVLREIEELGERRPDPLTGLAQHSRLLGALDDAVLEAARKGDSLALILIDTDDLAAVNRAHGPQAGDQVLRGIAEILLEEAGSGDLVVRYGMEEFALLAPGTDPRQVRKRAEEIQRRVQERGMPGPSGSDGVSVSVGVACLPDSLASDSESLRLKAEQALDLARQRRPGGLIIL